MEGLSLIIRSFGRMFGSNIHEREPASVVTY